MDWERLRRLIKAEAVAVRLDAPEWEWQHFRNGNGSINDNCVLGRGSLPVNWRSCLLRF